MLINAWHPAQANWSPIEEALTVRWPFTTHLRDLVQMLRQLANHVPRDVVDRLVPTLRALMTSPPNQLHGNPDVRRAATMALASLRPQEFSDRDLWNLLSGDTGQRGAAAWVVTVRDGGAQALPVLAALINDADVEVRAIVAACLSRLAVDGDNRRQARELLVQILADSGTLVARIAAERLSNAPDNDPQLLELLRNHISAQVRQNVR